MKTVAIVCLGVLVGCGAEAGPFSEPGGAEEELNKDAKQLLVYGILGDPSDATSQEEMSKIEKAMSAPAVEDTSDGMAVKTKTLGLSRKVPGKQLANVGLSCMRYEEPIMGMEVSCMMTTIADKKPEASARQIVVGGQIASAIYKGLKVKDEPEVGGSKKVLGSRIECKQLGEDFTCFVNVAELESMTMADAIKEGLFTKADAKKAASMLE